MSSCSNFAWKLQLRSFSQEVERRGYFIGETESVTRMTDFKISNFGGVFDLILKTLDRIFSRNLRLLEILFRFSIHEKIEVKDHQKHLFVYDQQIERIWTMVSRESSARCFLFDRFDALPRLYLGSAVPFRRLRTTVVSSC
ncbi:unnamed protein product [Victoria cruziana]